jgi:hypothetical protein
MSLILNLSQHPTTPKIIGKLESRVPQAKDFAVSMQKNLRIAKECLKQAQEKQKSYGDSNCRDMSYRIEQKVLPSSKNLLLKHPGTKKLLPTWLGTYEVIENVGKLACKLNMPKAMKIHLVFHVSLIKPYDAKKPVQPPTTPEILVERILKHRERKIGKKGPL